MNNIEQAKKILNRIFKEAYFVTYEFGTSFTLTFSRNSMLKIGENEVRTIRLSILADWIVGTIEEWEDYKKKFDMSKGVEEDEPVQAFFLTLLRWSGKAEVKEINLDSENFIIKFSNEKTIRIKNCDIQDYAWVVDDADNTLPISKWSITAEHGEIFINNIIFYN